MAVTFDAVGTVVTANSTTAISQTSLTVGSGTNRVLVAQIVWSSTPPTAITLNWSSSASPQALTAITGATATSTSNSANTAMYGLVNPSSGLRTLAATWTGTRDVYLQGVCWTGADQTGGVTTFANGGSTTGATRSSSLTITSASSNAVMATFCTADSFVTINNTQTFLNNTAALMSGAGNRAAGAATVVMNTSMASSAPWAAVGVNIVAAGAGVTPQFGGVMSSITRQSYMVGY